VDGSGTKKLFERKLSLVCTELTLETCVGRESRDLCHQQIPIKIGARSTPVYIILFKEEAVVVLLSQCSEPHRAEETSVGFASFKPTTPFSLNLGMN